MASFDGFGIDGNGEVFAEYVADESKRRFWRRQVTATRYIAGLGLPQAPLVQRRAFEIFRRQHLRRFDGTSQSRGSET